MRVSRYILVFILGFFIAKFWYQQTNSSHKVEETTLMINTIKNMSKLVVSSGNFSEVYNYTDSKKYFYDVISFDKKAIVTVNAKVEVGYDLSKLEIQVDSLEKKIYINSIPKEEISIIPDVKYYDLQQSQFNSFSKEDLNELNKKSIQKIEETKELTLLKTKAKERFFEEISKIYQLSAIYNWQVIDNTKTNFFNSLDSLID